MSGLSAIVPNIGGVGDGFASVDLDYLHLSAVRCYACQGFCSPEAVFTLQE